MIFWQTTHTPSVNPLCFIDPSRAHNAGDRVDRTTAHVSMSGKSIIIKYSDMHTAFLTIISTNNSSPMDNAIGNSKLSVDVGHGGRSNEGSRSSRCHSIPVSAAALSYYSSRCVRQGDMVFRP